MGNMEQIGEDSGFWKKIPQAIINFGNNKPELFEEKGTQEKRKAALEVINGAFALVEKKYGTGIGDGESPKFYHNLNHTKSAVEAVRKIAELAFENGNLVASEVVLAEIAAAGHDIEQDLGSGENEKESARETAIDMESTHEFAIPEVEKVERMISATKVSFEGGVMKQSATEEYLTQIIADADLSALGQPPEKYWAAAQALLKEMKNTETPSLEDELAWARGQVPFLSNHQFYTDEAKKLFPHKEANIAFAKEQISRLEAEISPVK